MRFHTTQKLQAIQAHIDLLGTTELSTEVGKALFLAIREEATAAQKLAKNYHLEPNSAITSIRDPTRILNPLRDPRVSQRKGLANQQPTFNLMDVINQKHGERNQKEAEEHHETTSRHSLKPENLCLSSKLPILEGQRSPHNYCSIHGTGNHSVM